MRDCMPQQPCTDECPAGRHHHLEDATAENEWADEVVKAEVPGGFGLKATSFFGEPVATPEDSAATMRAVLARPQRLVPVD